MTCYEDTEDDKNGNGDGENKQESKNPEAYEGKVGPGTPRNTEEPQGTPLTQSYIFMTQVMNEWVMSMIEDNSATPRVPSSVRSWMESSQVWRRRDKLEYDQRTSGSREINIGT